MKAKDWSKKFNESDILGVLIEYVTETVALINKRGHSQSAIEGVFREQEQKFYAIMKLVRKDERNEPIISDHDLHYAYQEYAPKLYAVYNKVASDQYLERRKRVLLAQRDKDFAEASKAEDAGLGLILTIAAIHEYDFELKRTKDFINNK